MIFEVRPYLLFSASGNGHRNPAILTEPILRTTVESNISVMHGISQPASLPCDPRVKMYSKRLMTHTIHVTFRNPRVVGHCWQQAAFEQNNICVEVSLSTESPTGPYSRRGPDYLVYLLPQLED